MILARVTTATTGLVSAQKIVKKEVVSSPEPVQVALEFVALVSQMMRRKDS